MIVINSTAQLRPSVGKVVRLTGLLRQTRAGTFIACEHDVTAYLEPPPDLSELKLGTKATVLGTLASRAIPPYDPNTPIPFARPTNAQATTVYVLNNYEITEDIDGP